MMSLRSRITLMVTLVSLALIVALILDGNWKAQDATDEMNRTRLQGQATAWATLAHNALLPLDRLVLAAARNRALSAALLADDPAALSAVMKGLQGDFGGDATAATLEIVTADGKPMLSGEPGEAILNNRVIAAAKRSGGPVSGLYITATGAPVLAVVAPLYSRTGLIGAVGAWIEPHATVRQVAAAIGAETVLTDAAERFPVASVTGLPLARLLAAAEGVQTIFDGGRRLQVTRIAVPLVSGEDSEWLLGVVDVSEAARRRFWLSLISRTGVISATVLFLAFLHWYLRRSFR